jgi:dTMP kinase
MPTQIIPLKARADSQDPSRIPAREQTAMNVRTTTARRSVADRKNCSRAEARQAAEEERRGQEELQRTQSRQGAEEERRRQEELQRAEARQAAEEQRRRQEAENKPFWNRFLAMLRARDS